MYFALKLLCLAHQQDKTLIKENVLSSEHNRNKYKQMKII